MPDNEVTLRDYFESQLEAYQRAVEIATRTLDKRLDGMNEFRDTLRDQASRFVTRDELALKVDVLQAQIGELKKFRDQAAGKADTKAVYIAYALAVIGPLLWLLDRLL